MGNAACPLYRLCYLEKTLPASGSVCRRDTSGRGLKILISESILPHAHSCHILYLAKGSLTSTDPVVFICYSNAELPTKIQEPRDGFPSYSVSETTFIYLFICRLLIRTLGILRVTIWIQYVSCYQNCDSMPNRCFIEHFACILLALTLNCFVITLTFHRRKQKLGNYQ